MSGENYLLGVVVLVAVVGPLWLAAYRLRAHVVPEWSGRWHWSPTWSSALRCSKPARSCSEPSVSPGAVRWSRPRWELGSPSLW
ncbi:MAG: hypothetical protein M3Q30_10795 [Actinomycetota bacterium]|nr:hypothetical protein [Actinomycetota bacterium]